MTLVKATYLAVFAILVAAAFVSPGLASATVLCDTKETVCAGPSWYEAETALSASGTAPVMSGAIKEECNELTLKGEMTDAKEQGSGTLIGTITGLTMTGSCKPCTTVKALGTPYEATLVALTEPVGDGTLTINKPRVQFTGCPLGVTCTFGASSAALTFSGGNPAKVTASSVSFNFEEGTSKVACGETSKLTVEAEVTAPKPAYASKDVEPATLCAVEPEEVEGELACPEGEGFSGEVEGELAPETEAVFESKEGPSGAVKCDEATFTAKFLENGKSASSGGFTSFTFGSESGPCTSTLPEVEEAEVEVVNLPYDATTLTYQPPPIIPGLIRIKRLNGEIRYVMTLRGPFGQAVCTFKKGNTPPTAEFYPPVGGNPAYSVVKYPLALEKEEPKMAGVCPGTMHINVTYDIGPGMIYSARP